MAKILSFYDQSVFNQYKLQVSKCAFEVVSVSNYLSKEKAETIVYDEHIVDLSSVGNSFNASNSMQLVFEQIYPFFDEDTQFICDIRYKDLLEFELRFCFDQFEELTISVNEKTIQNKDITNRVKVITKLSRPDLDNFINVFNSQLYGHEKFKSEFEDLVNTFIVFNKLGEHKVLSLFLMGESGVGKTEVGRQIHKCLGAKKKLAKINFGNYSSKDALNSLIGSPRGYIGSDGGELFERVEKTDVGLILIDEFEKSNYAVFNYFLDVLENGKLTNSLAEEIDVNGYIIVFTSNISTENFFKSISPELRSRFDYIGEFKLLNSSDKRKFVEFRFKSIIGKYNKMMNDSLNDEVLFDLIKSVEVKNFKNMRDLNKAIKNAFVKCLENLKK